MNWWMTGPIAATLFVIWFALHDIKGEWPSWVHKYLDWVNRMTRRTTKGES